MRRQTAWLLPLLVLSGCRGDSPTSATATEALQFPSVMGSYKAVMTTFIRFLDGPRRGNDISTVCPGEFIVTEQQNSLFFAELTMFHQNECLPVEAEYRGGISSGGAMTLDITFIHPPLDESCVQTNEAATATYRGSYQTGRFDISRRVIYRCTEANGKLTELELNERLEGLPPDA